jgi:hypothetical protein
MPIESILVSALVVSVFSVFGAVLAYAEHQTRHFKRPSDHVDESQKVEDRWLEAA